MKGIIRKVISLSVVTAAFIAPPALADNLKLEGNGVWRDKDGGQGQYLLYTGISWEDCRNMCLASGNCTGVEFVLRTSGISTCEVHTGSFSHIKESTNGNASVWLKHKD